MIRSIVRRFGRPRDVIGLEPAKSLPAGDQRVVVRMSLSAINPSDLLTIEGRYPSRTPLPFVPGFEGVGVVTAASGCGLRAGQRVLPIGSAGCWARHKALAPRWCVPVPDTIGDEAAATAYINPLTAALMIEKACLRPGMAVAINAPCSAIGRILIRLAAKAGAHPVAVLRDPDQAVRLADEPTADCLLQNELPGPRRAWSVGFDAVGGAAGMAMAQGLVPGGTLFHYGLLSGTPLLTEQARLPANIRVVMFRLRDWVHGATRQQIRQAMDRVFQAIEAGDAAVAIEACYPLDRLRDAIDHDARAGRRGKIIVRLGV